MFYNKATAKDIGRRQPHETVIAIKKPENAAYAYLVTEGVRQKCNSVRRDTKLNSGNWSWQISQDLIRFRLRCNLCRLVCCFFRTHNDAIAHLVKATNLMAPTWVVDAR